MGVYAALVHGELALLTKASSTELTSEPLLDIGVDTDVVAGKIVPTGELLGTSGADKPPLALMLDDLMLSQGILASEALTAQGVLAGEASGSVEGVDFCDVSLELASATKGARAERADEFGRAASGADYYGEQLKRIGGLGWLGGATAAQSCGGTFLGAARHCLTCQGDRQVGIASARRGWGLRRRHGEELDWKTAGRRVKRGCKALAVAGWARHETWDSGAQGFVEERRGAAETVRSEAKGWENLDAGSVVYRGGGEGGERTLQWGLRWCLRSEGGG